MRAWPPTGRGGCRVRGTGAPCIGRAPVPHLPFPSTLGSHTHIQRFHSSRARSQSVCREESAHPPYPPSRRWPPGGSHFVTSSMPPGRETLQSCNRANESDKGKLVWLPSGSRLRKIQDATRNQVTPFRVFGPHLGVQRAATCPAAARGAAKSTKNVTVIRNTHQILNDCNTLGFKNTPYQNSHSRQRWDGLVGSRASG